MGVWANRRSILSNTFPTRKQSKSRWGGKGGGESREKDAMEGFSQNVGEFGDKKAIVGQKRKVQAQGKKQRLEIKESRLKRKHETKREYKQA